jgi:hypothetical protein
MEKRATRGLGVVGVSDPLIHHTSDTCCAIAVIGRVGGDVMSASPRCEVSLHTTHVVCRAAASCVLLAHVPACVPGCGRLRRSRWCRDVGVCDNEVSCQLR